MMNSKLRILVLCVPVASVYFGLNAFGQQPDQTGSAPSSEEAEREKIWNSADMLRARAWMEDYFRVSKKYTPEQADEYRAHFKAMTAKQMEIWLMKFDHDRQMAHQQAAFDQNTRHIQVAHDLATLRQSQKTLDDVNKQENQVAAEADKRIEQQRQAATEMNRQRQAEQSQTLRDVYGPPYLPGGVYNYHYHIYP